MSNFIKPHRHKTILAAAIVLLALHPETAHAQGALFDSGTNFLTALMDLLTGVWAKIIAVIAICGLGILWMSGRMALGVAASIIGGIVLILGAPAIVESIAGSI